MKTLIALVGYSCRVPDSPNIASFRELLVSGKVANDFSIRHFPTRKSSLFSIPAFEAQFISAPISILLNSTYELFENACFPYQDLREKPVGVFLAGGTSIHYLCLD